MAGNRDSDGELLVGDENPKDVARTVLMTGGFGGDGGQAIGASVGGRGGDGEGPKIDQLVAHQITMILLAPSQLNLLPDVLAALIPPDTVEAVKSRNSTSLSPSRLAFGILCLSLCFLAWIFMK
ncbi:hypothetical protein MVEN_02405100 [Mycena venus]|uniref:Uncharacterized protein n=1 Tax=Mycena venus TaxID=2733690 RepID=A0A8H6X232_9AGAR|nr:hypothetical protein MVEN_02405100 [Mycena venus]